MNPRTVRIFEGEPFTFTERVKHRDGTDITSADVVSISLRVFDGGTQVLALDDIDPYTTILDTLQLDGEWTRDTDGYNFRHLLREHVTRDVFTGGGKTYQLEYKLLFREPGLGFKIVRGRVSVEWIQRTD